MPLILGTNSIKDTGYDVANSLRFDEASTTFLSKASFGTPTSTKKSTVSFWCKRSLVEEGIIFMNDSATFPVAKIYFDSSHRFSYLEFDPSTNLERTTNAVFRDLSAWSHFVVAVDTTQGTADNRVKIYHNGTQITSFSASTNPAQDSNVIINNNLRTGIGGTGSAGGDGFEGYVAELVRIDGQALAPTSFGEFDEDSGIWKPKDVSGLTFGTNGFYLDFEDSSALGNDKAGSNNFTVNNLTAIDQSTDTCTNNFATLNPLLGTGVGSYSEGNLKISGVSGNWSTAFSTIAVTQGKWYVEGKSLSTSMMAGVISTDQAHNVINDFQGKQSRGWGYESTGTLWHNSNPTTSWGSTYTTNDIIGVALDLDNNRLFFSKNGAFQNSGDPTSSTGAISIPSGYEWYIAYSPVDSTAQQWELNFGSPSFTISSGNADADSHGNFEYAVPSGYYSLNTKNLAEYG